MFARSALLGLAALVVGCATSPQPAPASPAPPPPPEGFIDPAALQRHVEVLASDEFGGRSPGTEGEMRTVEYLVAQMKAIGLSPGNGDSFLQPVPLRRVTVDPKARIQIAGDQGNAELAAHQDLIFLSDGGSETAKLENAPIVFVGFGIHAPTAGHDDYAGLDLKGKVALMLFGAPPRARRQPELARGAGLLAKLAQAAEKGAVAALIVLPPQVDDETWEAQVAERGGAVVTLESESTRAPPLAAILRAPGAERLIATAGESLQRLFGEAMSDGFKPLPLSARASAEVRSEVQRFQSSNVVGRLPGRERPEEHVLFITHWDGLGTCPADPTGDGLCNGAVDNASGVGGLLELARAFARAPRTARSLLFVSTTAEESGLLGAEHYAAHPTVPLAQTVGGMGMDTIAVRGKGADVVLLGMGLSELDPFVEEAAAAQGRAVTEVSEVQRYFTASDHFALAKAGVPMVIATGVFAQNVEAPDAGPPLTEAYMGGRYHQASDDPDAGVRYDGAAEDMALAYAFGKALAESTAWPNWKEQVPFRRVRDAQRPPAAP